MSRLAFLALLPLFAGCSDYELVTFEVVDVFFQNPAEEVDILMVVDNSGSMLPYQQKLGVNFTHFITYFIDAQIDYHIGVVTTTLEKQVYNSDYPQCTQAMIDAIPDAGHLVNATIITPDTPDAAEMFNELVNVGTCGSGSEKGLEAAAIALDDNQITGANYGFLRNDADLSIIFVSDEQDGSPLTTSEYVNEFFEVKGQRSRSVFNASALAVTDTSECTGDQADWSALGTRYIDVAHQTGGVVGNLCSDDFETIVTELSLNASRLRDTFYLSQFPQMTSLQVSIDDDVIPCDSGAWWYEVQEIDGVFTPTIIFTRILMPPPGSQVAIRYNPGGGLPENFCIQEGESGDTGLVEEMGR